MGLLPLASPEIISAAPSVDGMTNTLMPHNFNEVCETPVIAKYLPLLLHVILFDVPKVIREISTPPHMVRSSNANECWLGVRDSGLSLGPRMSFKYIFKFV
jgi:hypothetical protein